MRAGRWHLGEGAALAMSYIGSICVDAGLVLVGFPKDAGAYVIPWACLEPPEALKQQLWPWLDEQLLRVERVRGEYLAFHGLH